MFKLYKLLLALKAADGIRGEGCGWLMNIDEGKGQALQSCYIQCWLGGGLKRN